MNNISNLLDLESVSKNSSFNETEHQSHHHFISRWITESKRFDSVNFFKALAHNNSLEEGLINDIRRIHKKSEKYSEFYWENKVLGSWFPVYINRILGYSEKPDLFKEDFINSNLGNISSNVCKEAMNFLNSRFGHSVGHKEQIVEELQNWYNYQ
jgi:hypothetical protein